MDYSLMFPQGADRNYKLLTDEAVNDLSIDFITGTLTDQKTEQELIKSAMIKITDDPKVIRYRCDVFDDFLRFPKLREAMIELTLKLADLRDLERFQKDHEASHLWSLINRIREIDDYVSCIRMIKDTLSDLDIQSEGLLTLKQMVTDIERDSGFDELKKDIDETLEKARALKSITIGVNLDAFLRPRVAGVISLNDTKFTDSGLMKRFMNFANQKDGLVHGNDVSSFKQFHPANDRKSTKTLADIKRTPAAYLGRDMDAPAATGDDPLSEAIKKPVTEILKHTVNDIKSTLRRYVNTSGYTLTKLLPEILFYVRWAELVDKIKETGMPMCKPVILEPDERNCSFKELYNLKLVINKVNGEDINIITNEIEFNDEQRIFILTGPNRGGKTIFTQAWGLAMLLGQLGIYVPASYAAISPCDNIYTHFPADENDTVDLGRLGEESKRLSEIFDVATSRSIMLLNESLATTSVTEGLFIAKDVVKAMRYLGARAIFNTHMHDLARSCDEMNSEVEGTSKAASLVTGVHDGERSFKVSLLPPQGISYAKDIALKYGVSFKQIKESIDSKTS